LHQIPLLLCFPLQYTTLFRALQQLFDYFFEKSFFFLLAIYTGVWYDEQYMMDIMPAGIQ